MIFGTIVAYLVYLASLQYISPTAASLLDAFEPLGATVTSVVFLGFAVSGAELAGGALIIACVGLMALAARRHRSNKGECEIRRTPCLIFKCSSQVPVRLLSA